MLAASSAFAVLPAEYREVEYLESSGTQYVDTGVVNLPTDGISCTFKFLTYKTSGENWAFASWSGGGLRYGVNTSGALTGTGDFTATTDANGWSTATRISFTTTSTGISTYLYAQNENSKPYHLGSHIQISRFTVTRDGATFCDLVPCIRRSDSKPGFYDIAGDGGFRVNMAASGDDFTPGPYAGAPKGKIAVVGTPENYGTVTPAYGLSEIQTNGTATTFTVGLSTFEDGRKAVSLADGKRIFLKSCQITEDDTTLATETEVPFSYTFSEVNEFLFAVWSFTNVQWRTVATAGTGGTVKVGDAAAGASSTGWGDETGSISISAIPSDGYAFFKWTGDGVTDANLTDNPLVLSSDRVRNVQATFVSDEPGRTGEDVTWSSGAPTFKTNDRVTVPEGATVVLDAATPHLASFEVSGTVVVSNWLSRIDADAITVSATGVIRAGTDGYLLNGMTPNRVWLKGETLTVDEGGAISADAAGYAGTNGPCWTASVTRRVPGDNRNISPFGGSYGGTEGYAERCWRSLLQYVDNPKPYGSAEWPYDPGSGAGAFIRSGGGAIFLDFSCAVTVNGAVKANASSAYYEGYPACESTNTKENLWNYTNAGYGSGGGVLVKCRTIEGTGTVSANSVQAKTTSNRSGYGGGSGGRVAIHYDAAAQSNATCAVRFEARGGIGCAERHGDFAGEPGTIWFTDNQFLDTYQSAGWTFAGTWMSGVGQPSALSVAGDLALSESQLQFAEPIVLSVGGNLTLSGARIYAETCGLIFKTNASVTVAGNVTLTDSKLALLGGGAVDVKGDFKMSDSSDIYKGSLVYLTAGATNGTANAYGVTLDVGGLWSVGQNAVAALECHHTDGAIPVLACSNFFLHASGTLLASNRGYDQGPGYVHQNGRYCGSGYGGNPGGSNGPAVRTYGNAEEPIDPGSGDNHTGESGLSRGGGVISLTVRNEGTVNGQVLADSADLTLASSQVWYYNGASGGSIYLRIKHLYGSDSALVRAAGGGPKGNDYWYNNAYLGSGGRVAIWTFLNDSNWKDSWTSATVAPAMYKESTPPNYIPENGTFYWGTLPSTDIAVDGTPARYGTVTPPWGSSPLALSGQDNTFDIVRTTFDDGLVAVDLGTGHRIFPASCAVIVDGVTEMTSSTYPFVWQTPASYTSVSALWTFESEQYSLIADAQGRGTVQFAGGVSRTVATNWCAAGTSVTVTATPAANCAFLNWSGDGITASNGAQNPLTLAMDAQPMNLKANFVYSDPSHTATDVETADGKVSALGPGDRVTVPAGVTSCIDAATPRLGKLEVSGTLVLSNWTTRVEADEIVVRNGGVIKAGTDGFVLSDAFPNRVWLKGGSLTVEAGGKIDADGAGYAGTNGPCWTASVTRTIRTSECRISPYGGAYGGREGYCLYTSYGKPWGTAPEPYGSAEWPYDAGSGGGPLVRAGGGAIYLDFTGAVTVDGCVSADASDAGYAGYPAWEAKSIGGYSSWYNVNASYGSGGGIVIVCSSVSGAGSVSASSRVNPNWVSGFGGGSGGRIAVHYDAAAQQSATCTVSFRARGGIADGTQCRGVWAGDPGTLWFADNQFLESYAATGWTFAGTWHSGAGAPAGYAHTGDLRVVDAQLRFPEPFNLSVSGELCVTGTFRFATASGLAFGTNATVSAGSVTIKDARLALEDGGSLATAGNLTLVDAEKTRWQSVAEASFRGSLLHLQAGMTNGTDRAYGLTCTVGGKFSVGQYAVVLPYCHLNDGAIPAFSSRDLFVHSNGVVNASSKGYYDKGPIRPAAQYGTSHGGLGGGTHQGSPCYGSATEPLMPGCGDSQKVRGGGVVFLDVSHHARIDGQILADAKDPIMIPSGGGTFISGASGGSIYLRLQRLIGGTNAVVRALGGGPLVGGDFYLGDAALGGGGRIAIYTGVNRSDWKDNANRVSAVATQAPNDDAVYRPQDGTVYWEEIPPLGFTVIVR